jgi:NADH:ubiquinone oxidoreductase subunit
MLYQLLNDESNEYRRRMVTARLSAPSKPSCTSSDWRFYLHNIRSRNPNSISYIKNNVQKSIAALKQNPQGTTADTAQKYITELERCLSILQQTPPGHSADPGLLNAKKIALDVLDSTRGKFVATQQSKAPFGNHSKEPPRSKMGFLKNYELTSEQYRKLELAKEDYMVNALKLKEELEAKNKDDAAAALSDEEDDEEEGEASEDKPDAEPKPDVEMPDAPSATSENPASNETAVTAEASNEEANRDTQNPASNEAAVTAEASDQEAKQDTVDSTTT